MPAAVPVRILLVEDSPALGRLLARALRGEGWDVLGPVATADAAEALCRAADPPVAAAVLDIRLPGSRDGLALAAALHTRHPLPIVFITGADPRPLLPQVRRLPGATLLRKPCSLAVLIDLLLLALADPAGPATPPAPAPGGPAPALADCLLLRRGRRTDRVPLGEVCYLRACDKHCDVVTTGPHYAPRQSLKALARQLAGGTFLRIHRSCLVNLAHFERYHAARCCVVVAGQELAVGRDFRPALLRWLRRAG